MRPSPLALMVLASLAGLALGLALLRQFVPTLYSDWLLYGWWFAFALLGLLLLADTLGLRRREVDVERILPGSFAVGVGNKVHIRLQNLTNRDLKVAVADHHPSQIKADNLPFSLMLPAGEAAELTYLAVPQKRGDAHFGDVDLRIRSGFGLWEYRRRFPQAALVKVYPNFTAISQFEQLGHQQQIAQLGVHRMQRRGQGMDFHQLRDYRDGDVSRQIDWNASSRRRKMISRDYQDERDQDIIFLLDCGRRMRAKDAELSHFDHCLNSLLLMSYVALRQGDAIGMLSFAGEQRWLAPIKGKNNINVLLNNVYDLHSGTDTSDLVEAASELMQRHRKRALVVIMSNLREEDAEDITLATRVLAKKHLVLVASLRESFLDEARQTPVTDLESSLVYCETTDLMAHRNKLLQTLRGKGVVVTDSVPQSMHIQLVNEYWALKRSGRI
ncbi:DUF58 domain-containing protein [Proteobacteria bacterium 005FR1]|nr:DUF58 domain-containing protein [Proteobacteria bacterium 005FR1]